MFRSPLRRLAVALLAAVFTLPSAWVRAHEIPPSGGPIGLLIADHGEPPEYNEWTYYSFRKFFQHLIEMGILPSFLTHIDNGTILQDLRCPLCPTQSDHPQLVDAWLHPHDGPAVFVPATEQLPAHYVMPGGPGLREPDIFEHIGLSAWDEWRRMGGRSPNYDEKLPRKEAVIASLTEQYGDRLAIRVGYGIDPRIDGGDQSIRRAVEGLINRDRVEALVVAYHGVGFSDIMQTHMINHEIHEALEALGAHHIPVRFTGSPSTGQLAGTSQYVQAVVDKVKAELAAVPKGTDVALHLSGHGLSTTDCGDYACGADGYHEYSAKFFERVRDAIARDVRWSGRLGVFHVYGEGGDDESDPDDLVDSPMEALAKRKAQAFERVVDIPHEFDANSRDTLIVLRRGYGLEPPAWNSRLESFFTYEGIPVKIANSLGGEALKTAALEQLITDALAEFLPTKPSGKKPPKGGPNREQPGRLMAGRF